MASDSHSTFTADTLLTKPLKASGNDDPESRATMPYDFACFYSCGLAVTILPEPLCLRAVCVEGHRHRLQGQCGGGCPAENSRLQLNKDSSPAALAVACLRPSRLEA